MEVSEKNKDLKQECIHSAIKPNHLHLHLISNEISVTIWKGITVFLLINSVAIFRFVPKISKNNGEF